MRFHVPMVLALALACPACRSDDTDVTVRTQARVNQAVTTDSDIQVAVRDGVATLTGMASSETAHRHALEAAESTEGVRDVVDRVIEPVTVTGGTMQK